MAGKFVPSSRMMLYVRDGWTTGWETILSKDEDGGKTYDLRYSGGWIHDDPTLFRDLTDEDGLEIAHAYAARYLENGWAPPDYPVRFVLPSGKVVTVPFQ